MASDTAQRTARLSPEAQRLYRRLLWWWLTTGEWLWTRRDLYQRVKSGPHYRRVAELDARLVELRAAGVIRRWDQRGLAQSRAVIAYALVTPQPHHGKLPGRPRLPYAPAPS